VGELGASLTAGIQAHNVMACVKHYAFNNIENSRFFVNVQADDRTLHEVYLAHFKRIIKAGAASVMGAYNLFRGDQACESRLLLTEILRGVSTLCSHPAAGLEKTPGRSDGSFAPR
jgi:beta-glucosidase